MYPSPKTALPPEPCGWSKILDYVKNGRDHIPNTAVSLSYLGVWIQGFLNFSFIINQIQKLERVQRKVIISSGFRKRRIKKANGSTATEEEEIKQKLLHI